MLTLSEFATALSDMLDQPALAECLADSSDFESIISDSLELLRVLVVIDVLAGADFPDFDPPAIRTMRAAYDYYRELVGPADAL